MQRVIAAHVTMPPPACGVRASASASTGNLVVPRSSALAPTWFASSCRPECGSAAAHVSQRSAVVASAAAKASGKGFGAVKAPSVAETCACGSKVVYRECCEPYHTGAAVAPDVDAALRARFCAFVKGRIPYLLSTFHPTYHSFKFEGAAPGGAPERLRRELEQAVERFKYSGLKVLEVTPGSTPDEAFISFRYNSLRKIKTDQPRREQMNLDGSFKVSTTVERSRFLRDASSGAWLFADYELMDYPTWMEDAKQAELRARGVAEVAPAAVAAAASASA